MLTPVDGTDGSRSIIRVRVSGRSLTRGVASAWAILALLGIAMLLLAVAVADRLARSIVRPVRAVEMVTRRLQSHAANNKKSLPLHISFCIITPSTLT